MPVLPSMRRPLAPRRKDRDYAPVSAVPRLIVIAALSRFAVVNMSATVGKLHAAADLVPGFLRRDGIDSLTAAWSLYYGGLGAPAAPWPQAAVLSVKR